MARLLIIFGILFWVAATIFLIVALGGAGEELSGQLLAPFICEADETLGLQQRNMLTSTGSGQTIDFYCVDSEDDERDVTHAAIPVLIVVFVGLLVSGIIAFIVGVNLIAWRATRQISGFWGGQNFGSMSAQQGSIMDLRDGVYQQYQTQNPEEMHSIFDRVFSQVGQAFKQDSLSERLQQLEDARQKGLISQAEYERVRQSILDNMDN